MAICVNCDHWFEPEYDGQEYCSMCSRGYVAVIIPEPTDEDDEDQRPVL